MCIICNCGNDGADFLRHFNNASIEMKKAKDSMKDCSNSSSDSKSKKNYDRAHKKMARLIRLWNSIEHERENYT